VRYGNETLAEHFHSFDTICSATQDRQDAVQRLAGDNVDLMIVIGGYNSSNTNNLAKIASNFTNAFHIEDASAIISADQIRHKSVVSRKEVIEGDWFPESASIIGITAGASTPNNQIGEAIERIAGFRGTIDIAQILGVH
jgi:4-hydroxy-3-methylbut-2-enyl diphosphate reductase